MKGVRVGRQGDVCGRPRRCAVRPLLGERQTRARHPQSYAIPGLLPLWQVTNSIADLGTSIVARSNRPPESRRRSRRADQNDRGRLCRSHAGREHREAPLLARDELGRASAQGGGRALRMWYGDAAWNDRHGRVPGMHLDCPSFGHVACEGDHFRFVPDPWCSLLKMAQS
jgi:hypothetical protein